VCVCVCVCAGMQVHNVHMFICSFVCMFIGICAYLCQVLGKDSITFCGKMQLAD
jgi:hypothetical protein